MNCTNNKDVFLTIMHHHVREGHLQYVKKLHADLADEDSEEVLPIQSTEEWLARNNLISCKLGIRYPVLQAILSGRKNHQRLMVSHGGCRIRCRIRCRILYKTLSHKLSHVSCMLLKQDICPKDQSRKVCFDIYLNFGHKAY